MSQVPGLPAQLRVWVTHDLAGDQSACSCVHADGSVHVEGVEAGALESFPGHFQKMALLGIDKRCLAR